MLQSMAIASGAKLHMDACVTHVDSLQRPSIHLATGEIVTGDIVIGADGRNSIVRPVVTDEEVEVENLSRVSIT